jgi:hypothetical protein
MTIISGNFAKTEGVSPSDRSYTQATLQKWLGWLFPHDGVVNGYLNGLAVSATSPMPDIYVHVGSGAAIASGLFWMENTASAALQLNNADATYGRIDSVVVRFRLTGADYRDAILAVVPGIPAASPVAPTLTVSTDIIELELARVTVAAGVTQITTANITAAASQPLCSYMGARIGKNSIGNLGQLILSKDPTVALGAATKQYTDSVGLVSGMICLWSGSIASIPSGCVLCNGSNSTPDLRDKFVVGAGNTYAVGATGGEATHVLTTAEMPAHAHTITGGSQSGSSYVSIGEGQPGGAESTSTVGNGDAHNNLPPYYALAYIMKT